MPLYRRDESFSHVKITVGIVVPLVFLLTTLGVFIWHTERQRRTDPLAIGRHERRKAPRPAYANNVFQEGQQGRCSDKIVQELQPVGNFYSPTHLAPPEPRYASQASERPESPTKSPPTTGRRQSIVKMHELEDTDRANANSMTEPDPIFGGVQPRSFNGSPMQRKQSLPSQDSTLAATEHSSDTNEDGHGSIKVEPSVEPPRSLRSSVCSPTSSTQHPRLPPLPPSPAVLQPPFKSDMSQREIRSLYSHRDNRQPRVNAEGRHRARLDRESPIPSRVDIFHASASPFQGKRSNDSTNSSHHIGQLTPFPRSRRPNSGSDASIHPAHRSSVNDRVSTPDGPVNPLLIGGDSPTVWELSSPSKYNDSGSPSRPCDEHATPPLPPLPSFVQVQKEQQYQAQPQQRSNSMDRFSDVSLPISNTTTSCHENNPFSGRAISPQHPVDPSAWLLQISFESGTGEERRPL